MRHLAPHTQGKWNLNEDWTRLLEIAERQYAVLARRQALECGMTKAQLDRCIKQGRLELSLPGVYRMPGSPRTGRQRATAATLWLGADARVSHVTAAALLRLDGCTTRQLHLTTPRTVRRHAGHAEMNIHRCRDVLPFIDHATVDGIPCTSATRTVIDCAEYLDAEALEVAFESARRMGLTSPRTLSLRAEALCGRGKPGSAAIRNLIALQREHDPALQYRLEVKAERLLRAHRLPTPERQFPIGRYRIDLAYPPQRIGLECEGFEYHGNRLTWKQDKRRTAWIEAQDWRLLFLTWDDVTKRPEETIKRIRHALA